MSDLTPIEVTWVNPPELQAQLDYLERKISLLEQWRQKLITQDKAQTNPPEE